MKLAKATEENLFELMQWFTSVENAFDWSGPGFRYPFEIDSFKQDLKVDTLSSYCLIDSENNMLAFGQYYLRAERCHLGRLVVNPKYRGNGLASILITQLTEKGTTQLSTKDCSLFVLQHNTSAIKAYEKFGFYKTDYHEEIPLEHCDYMIKNVVVDG
jgi:ribosomal protein S18 acetylase RimI-like enzyme